MPLVPARWTQGCKTACALLTVGLTACSESPPPASSAAARVGEALLSLEAVSEHVPSGLAPEDSVIIAHRYVDQWIREQILVNQAEKALANQDVRFDAELTAYRNALVLHTYKERYVNDRLSAVVSEEEALAYYEENLQSFILTDYGLRALFINAPNTARLEEVRAALSTLDSTQVLDIERWCVDNGAIYALDGETWWNLNNFTKEVPMSFYRTASQLSSRRLVEFEADGRVYLVRFLEHALKDQVAPFSAVRKEVEEMIVHQRRKALLLEMEEQIVVKAWSEGDVERYTPSF